MSTSPCSQHGRTPLEGVAPTVHIRSGDTTRTFVAEPTGKPGVYHARVVFPSGRQVELRGARRLRLRLRPHVPGGRDRRRRFPGRACRRHRHRPRPTTAGSPPAGCGARARRSCSRSPCSASTCGAGRRSGRGRRSRPRDYRDRRRGGARHRGGGHGRACVHVRRRERGACRAAADSDPGGAGGRRPRRAGCVGRAGLRLLPRARRRATRTGSSGRTSPRASRRSRRPTSGTSIVAPDKAAAAGYTTGMMPEDYASRIAPGDLERLVSFLQASARR